jgi:hypothetical protein
MAASKLYYPSYYRAALMPVIKRPRRAVGRIEWRHDINSLILNRRSDDDLVALDADRNLRARLCRDIRGAYHASTDGHPGPRIHARCCVADIHPDWMAARLTDADGLTNRVMEPATSGRAAEGESMQIVIRPEDSNMAGFISWRRLADHLGKSGELAEGEHITRMNISETGINYFVLRAPNGAAQ